MSLLLQFGAKTQSLLHTDNSSNAGPHHVDPTDDAELFHQRLQSFSGCFGLPYQDHNYGAPPPATPPISPPPPPPAPVVKVNGHIDIDDVSCHTTIVTTDEPDIVTPEDSVTRCICEFQHDDGYMICCDRCGVWQHVDCMAVDRLNIPDIYYCEKCEPRKVDKHRAIQLQTKRRELLIQIDSSATDTEDETQEGKKKKKDKAKQKKNKKDRKENHKLPQLKGKFKFHKKQNKCKEVKPQVPSYAPIEETVPLQSFKKKLQTSPLSHKKKKFAKTHRSLSLDNSLSEDLMHRSWSSPESNVQNGLVSPMLPAAPAQDSPSSSYREPQTPGNQYSIEIETLLVSNKLNGQHKALSPRDVLSTPKQLLVQLCKVVQINAAHKGLEALDDIATNQPIIEYKGNVMTKDQFLKENEFYARPHPHVLFYKFDDRQLCVDASRLMCDACHIRRSCTPNTEVRHVVDNGNLHFYLYSSRCISKGAEFTIPFDFTHKECVYNVECACSRQSCPIAKNRKSDDSKSQMKVIRKKRRRSTKSQDTPVSRAKSQDTPVSRASVDPGPVSTSTPIQIQPKASKPLTTITKRRKLSSFSEMTTSLDHSPEKLVEKTSPPKTRSQEELLHSMKVDGQEAADRSSSGDVDIEEHTDDQKKMTREERKMDAILKAFEKMEKREERRKEALSRIDHVRKSTDGIKSPTEIIAVKKPDKSHDVTTEEDVKPEKVEIRIKKGKAKSKKRRISTPARRQSRANSGISMSAFDSGTSADESSIALTPFPTPIPSSAEPGSNTVTPSCANSDKAFRFPKTKKYRLSEWLHETGQDVQRPLSIKTDLSDIDSEETEFVKCVPSPHASSLSHLRRNSMSAASRDNQGKAVGSVSSQLDTSIGSAKKRWLRQAMFEHTGAPVQSPTDISMSPIQSGSTSPNPAHILNGSPGTSPLDFVTPLKKRRMARESVGSESHYPINSSLSPYPGMETLEHNTERLQDEEEPMFNNEDTSIKAEHVLFKKGGNGLCQRVSKMTPEAKHGNIFELMHKRSPDTYLKQESFDSSLSESVLSPDRSSTLPLESKHFCPVLSTVKDEQEEPEEGSKPVTLQKQVTSHEDQHDVSCEPSDEKDIKLPLKETNKIELDTTCTDSRLKVKDEEWSDVGVVKQECDTDSVNIEGISTIIHNEQVSKGHDSLSTAIHSGLGGSPSMNSQVDKSELVGTSGDLLHDRMKSLQSVDICEEPLYRIEASSSSNVPYGKKTEDNVQPSSSSDQNVSVVESNSGSHTGLSCVQTNSFKSTKQNMSNSVDALVDSSEPERVCSRTSLELSSSETNNCVKHFVHEQECDSTNREVGFEGSQRANSSVMTVSCSSSQSNNKEVDVRKTTLNSELSSSAELCEASELKDVIQSEADTGQSLTTQSGYELSNQAYHSQIDVSSDAEFQCSSSNTVEMISNSLSQAADQISVVSDSDLQPSSASTLMHSSTNPRSKQVVPETSCRDVSSESGISHSHANNLVVQVDSTQNPQRDFLSPSTSRKEDGELDSSMSDMERDSRSSLSCRPCKAESSNQSEAQPHISPVVEESEKEEGEITDDETEEESAIDCPVPVTSASSPVASVHSAMPTPSPSVESVPTSSGMTTHKHQSSDVNMSPSSSSSVFRWSFSSNRDRKDQDWGTPYRGSSNNNISSSSSAGTSSRRDRYTDYHRHSSSSTSRGSRSYDQRSPSREDSHLVDSSSSERSRHLSDDSNSNGLDNNISSTGCDHVEDSWKSARQGSIDNSPTGIGLDNSSPISSSGLLASFQPAKKKMSLTEYKKRMKQKRPESSRSSISARNCASTSGRSTPVTKDSNSVQDLITPLLPYFGTLGSSLNKDKALPKGTLPSLKDPKEESDVQWNACATTAERIREQTQLSLTERLRREFGLDASESEEDDERRKERRRNVSGGRQPSPEPPPPPPVTATLQQSKRDCEDDDQVPPPPPPGSYPQHTFSLPQAPHHINMVAMQPPNHNQTLIGSANIPNQSNIQPPCQNQGNLPTFSCSQMPPRHHGTTSMGHGQSQGPPLQGHSMPAPSTSHPRGPPISVPQQQQIQSQHQAPHPSNMAVSRMHSVPAMQSQGPSMQCPPPHTMPPPAAPPLHGHLQPGLAAGSQMPLHGPPQPVPPPKCSMPIHGPPQHANNVIPPHGSPQTVPPHPNMPLSGMQLHNSPGPAPNGAHHLPGPPQMLPPPPSMGGSQGMPSTNLCVGAPHVSQAPGMLTNPMQNQLQGQQQGQPQHQLSNFVPFDPSLPPPPQQMHQAPDDPWDPTESGSIPSLMSLSFPGKQYSQEYVQHRDATPTSSTNISSSGQQSDP